MEVHTGEDVINSTDILLRKIWSMATAESNSQNIEAIVALLTQITEDDITYILSNSYLLQSFSQGLHCIATRFIDALYMTNIDLPQIFTELGGVIQHDLRHMVNDIMVSLNFISEGYQTKDIYIIQDYENLFRITLMNISNLFKIIQRSLENTNEVIGVEELIGTVDFDYVQMMIEPGSRPINISEFIVIRTLILNAIQFAKNNSKKSAFIKIFARSNNNLNEVIVVDTLSDEWPEEARESAKTGRSLAFENSTTTYNRNERGLLMANYWATQHGGKVILEDGNKHSLKSLTLISKAA